jgi:hypothetical protein
MPKTLDIIYDELYGCCKEEDFAGYDPFDGLNSRIIKFTPMRFFSLMRLAWQQAVKRSPLDLRPMLLVPKGHNPKGLALFALGELARFRTTGGPEHSANSRELLGRLLDQKIDGKTAAGEPTIGFGYNFDWQSRAFYAPIGTPAIVPTAFASQALFEAYQIFGEMKYLNGAEAIARFVVHGLNRPYESEEEVCFSYTPVDRTLIFNASLLGAECLARVGVATDDKLYLDMAAKAVRFVIRRQRPNGSWSYGSDATQSWVDNFHTAYVLLSLYRISSNIEELRSETFDAIARGAGYWLDNFFLDDGAPKYYDNAMYPVDIHSAAVAISTLTELRDIDERMLSLARKTAEWTIRHLRDEQGYFYYQKRKNGPVKTPFMRWGQAWMAYALARLIESELRA